MSPCLSSVSCKGVAVVLQVMLPSVSNKFATPAASACSLQVVAGRLGEPAFCKITTNTQRAGRPTFLNFELVFGLYLPGACRCCHGRAGPAWETGR